jgi:hypothetical protein
MTAPATDAPFSDKMAYYRTQHTSRGARLTHMVEQHGELLARRSQRKAARRAAVRVPA